MVRMGSPVQFRSWAPKSAGVISGFLLNTSAISGYDLVSAVHSTLGHKTFQFIDIGLAYLLGGKKRYGKAEI